MANPTRTRKRVQAIRRAPDGSAFQTCDNCGVSIPVCLSDMHECETENRKSVKRFKGTSGKQQNVERLSCFDQPRSAFVIFMEDFVCNGKDWYLIDVNGQGFETWKRMSKKEREPYVIKAATLNSAYVRNMIQEIDDSVKVDDGADSETVGKFDPRYEEYVYVNFTSKFESFSS
ncbi:HMG-box (high mobility group) DNA-binding family protein [Euphorbia peplus]|nr:HMG-box (high mobility group) DNA-binding family protein [Euphorbia peplus]